MRCLSRGRLDRPGWERRKAKLDRGEETHPSGLGSTFLTLEGPPWVPTVPEAWKAEADAEAAAKAAPKAKKTKATAAKPQKKR